MRSDLSSSAPHLPICHHSKVSFIILIIDFNPSKKISKNPKNKGIKSGHICYNRIEQYFGASIFVKESIRPGILLDKVLSAIAKQCLAERALDGMQNFICISIFIFILSREHFKCNTWHAAILFSFFLFYIWSREHLHGIAENLIFI